MTIDLNADLGESFGAYKMGNDPALLELVSSANIACGFHAGDPLVLADTVTLAARRGVSLGAHPGYPDLPGFGRRSLSLTENETYACVLYQIGALRAFAQAAGSDLRHVKPHGALYNDAARDPSRARGIARAVRDAGGDLYLVGLPDCEMEKAAAEAGIPYAREFFADRAYEEDGTLVPRSLPGSVIQDQTECVERVLRAVQTGTVETLSGKTILVKLDTICLHGDNPRAVGFASLLRKSLEENGIRIRPFSPENRL